MKDKMKSKKQADPKAEVGQDFEENPDHGKKADDGDYENRYKRALADYQNLMKQSAREKQEFAKYANEHMLHKFLPIYDNLKTSLKHTANVCEDDPWVVGVKYVLKQFKDALSDEGVEEIEVVGKKFDHHTMDAVSGNGEKVIKELRPGYKLNGKVIIPAKVELETIEKPN